MSKSVEYIGKYPKPVCRLPSASNLIRCFKHEAIFLVGGATRLDEEKGFNLCYCIGYVKAVHTGENFDLVYMNFGANYDRRIVCKTSMARKQIYTLKINQVAQIYGYAKIYTSRDENGNKKSEMVIVASALQGWYVPKAFDRKHSEAQKDFQFADGNETDEVQDILSQFENY